ncbi:MAG: DUF3465 domain-containing protein [Woeseia sp.]
MKKLLILLAIIAAYAGVYRSSDFSDLDRTTAVPADSGNNTPEVISDRESGNQVAGNGAVVRILPDDNDGSRHQRFILRLESGQTLLIAHNIDVAPRVADLKIGDNVSFNGEYEWNAEGGVIHWTHHDPAGSHSTGWLKHGGRTYK